MRVSRGAHRAGLVTGREGSVASPEETNCHSGRATPTESHLAVGIQLPDTRVPCRAAARQRNLPRPGPSRRAGLVVRLDWQRLGAPVHDLRGALQPGRARGESLRRPPCPGGMSFAMVKRCDQDLRLSAICEADLEDSVGQQGSFIQAKRSGSGAADDAPIHAAARRLRLGLLPAGKDAKCPAIAPLQLHFRIVA